MKVVRIFASGLAASSVAFFAQAFNGGTFLGPIFAAPMNVSESPSLSSSLRQMTQSITKILGEKLGQDIENSVAICGFSIHDSGETPLFDYYHTGKDLSMHGTASVGPDTVFRIGSISKLFTVYLLLLQGGRNLLNEPIAKYLDIIPAYDNFNTNTNVEWGEITVGALAGQVGGILRDYNHADLASSNLPLQELGLPRLSDEDIPHCDGHISQPLCSKNEFLQGLHEQPAVFQVWETPAYSNAAFRILGYIAANVSNMTTAGALKTSIIGPLGLNNTYTARPSDYKGVIPGTGSLWDMELGEDMPAGGMYSSTRDLALLGKAILNNSQLSPVATRRWLKPITHTSSLYSSVGQPWEIFRHADGDHVVDFYTKGGSIGSYESLLVLIPDYGVAFSVLTAGKDNRLVLRLADVIKDTVLKHVATAAKEQSSERFAGRYEGSNKAGDALVIAVDGKPGLVIQEWKSNSVDFLQVAQDYASDTGSGSLESVRLYPTGISNKDQVIFRAVYNITTSQRSQSGLFEGGYQAWGSVDQLVYGQQPLDEFVFEVDDDQLATQVECKGLRRKLGRVN